MCAIPYVWKLNAIKCAVWYSSEYNEEFSELVIQPKSSICQKIVFRIWEKHASLISVRLYTVIHTNVFSDFVYTLYKVYIALIKVVD